MQSWIKKLLNDAFCIDNYYQFNFKKIMDPFKPTSFNYTLGETTTDAIKVVKAQPPSEVNYFAFELESRSLIDKLLKPIIEE